MNIEAFLLCDAATEQQGKLNVLGAFDNIFAREIPIKYPACSVATRIRFDKIEAGHHSVRIRIIDYDGRNIGPELEGNISVQIPDDTDSSVANLVLNIHGLNFEKHGQYRIDLAIDDSIKASLPLWVRKVPNHAR
jgi:hypothetical protein